MRNTIYLKRSTKTGIVRWAVVSPNNLLINKGEVVLTKNYDIVSLVKALKEKYSTTTAFQLLTID
jgi:hypothetical protein